MSLGDQKPTPELVSSSHPSELPKIGLNPSAKPFVPFTGAGSYESSYEPITAGSSPPLHVTIADCEEDDHHTTGPATHQPDFGKVMCTGDNRDQILKSFVETFDRQASEFSKDTREERGEDYDSSDLSEFENHEYQGVASNEEEFEEDEDDGLLTQEEREWLESQCEAKDNPPGFFW